MNLEGTSVTDNDEPYASKACGTADLLTIYTRARKLDLNRQLDDASAANLDPHGVHVLTLILLDHRAHESRNLPLHHRTSALLKMRGSGRPLAVLLDLTDEQWQKLPKLREANVEIGREGRLRPRLVDEPAVTMKG